MLEFHDGVIIYRGSAISTTRAAEILVDISTPYMVDTVIEGYTPGVSNDTVVLPDITADVISRRSFDLHVEEIDSEVFDQVIVGVSDVSLVSEWDDVTYIVHGDAMSDLRVFPNRLSGTFAVHKDTMMPSYIFGYDIHDDITDDEYRIYIMKNSADEWTLSLIDGEESFMVKGPIDSIWRSTKDEVMNHLQDYIVPTHIPGMLGRPFHDVDIITRD